MPSKSTSQGSEQLEPFGQPRGNQAIQDALAAGVDLDGNDDSSRLMEEAGFADEQLDRADSPQFHEAAKTRTTDKPPTPAASKTI